ncbi:MAG: transposase [Terracidiphilus sp.]
MPWSQITEGAGAFRPLKQRASVSWAFRPGPFVYPPHMRIAPQETRTYFVTAVTARRRSLFQVTATAELLHHIILDYRSQRKFLLHAFVIMPDHFHALITPAPDVSLEKAMQFIKGGFSFRLKSKLDAWERSFNESQISTEEKFISCVRYIEQNPVRRGLVSTSQAHPFSSASHGPLDPMPSHLRRQKAQA